ncbi:ActS/PrrB/RegB family redox-sensitive histidine kinase [Pseudorhodobacter turbinis]|uniref:histidine kinase n=1 Tax=Pseudorhodobacter turbinis TaxID=2500533 RepID=A0A4P8EGL2_9RHOB|nr:ActS/PrrB/RegB family redox-sensitive histidine kinase [Pseudorhodobacter turbinis]QCO55862.1 ActS/PrrB/RegB family redox-sensitive histidine kinase [Pseudorhodobacter turbinis]
MMNAGAGLFSRGPGDYRLRLHTLVVLRWMAIVGQLAAITIAYFYLDLRLSLVLCYLVVGMSVCANLLSYFIYPKNRRLSDLEGMLVLLFDLAQLSCLLFLTGGLTNPFALLIIAPVIISASALHSRTTVLLGVMAICLISFVTVFNIPLYFADGTVLTIQGLLEVGFWLAIVIGILFLGLYSYRVASEIQSMSTALLATQMALAREQKLTALGGVVAAAAHELGTPLATIKLVSTELIEELSESPDLRDDAQLIRDQADRCRDILRSMGRAGKNDAHLMQAPLAEVLREAAEPHMERGKDVVFTLPPDAAQHSVQRQPEVIHGLRNLIQNAVDFAKTTVWVEASWGLEALTIRVVDDGQGFDPQIIGRIGDPFVTRRQSVRRNEQRPEYEGMGLGLFIAKTLLERSGAELSFRNGSDPFLARDEHPVGCGAIVEVVWPLAAIIAVSEGVLGENTKIET